MTKSTIMQGISSTLNEKWSEKYKRGYLDNKNKKD
jgi:nicotinamide riboside kinase